MKYLLYPLVVFYLSCCVMCSTPSPLDEIPTENPTDKPGENPEDKPEDKPEEPVENPSVPPVNPDQNPEIIPPPPVEPADIAYTHNFVTDPLPSGYQLLDESHLTIVQAPKGVFYAPVAYSGWHSYTTTNGYGLSSYAYDGKEETAADNWVITDAMKVPSDRAMVGWKVFSESPYSFPESYEVYLSSSSSLNDIKATAPIYKADDVVADHSATQHIVNVRKLLENRAGQTIYLAFRHTTKGGTKIAITLAKIELSSFKADDADLEITSVRSWAEGISLDKDGKIFPVGLDLSVEAKVTNNGFDIINQPVTITCKNGSSSITETFDMSLFYGESKVVKFTKTIKHTESTDISVEAKPLPGEINTSNNANTLVVVNKYSRYAPPRIFFEEATSNSCSWCTKYFGDSEPLMKDYPDRVVFAMHMLEREGLQPAKTPEGEVYRDLISSRSRFSAAPYAAGNRSLVYTGGNGLSPSYKQASNGWNTFTSVMEKDMKSKPFASIDITAKQRFSADKKTMYLDIEVEALEDLNNLDLGIGGLVIEDGINNPKYTMQRLGQVTFNHIARAVLGPLKTGVKGVIPATMKAKDIVKHTFTYSIPEMYDVLVPNPNQMYAAVMIINPDGSILNCNKTQKGMTAASSAAYRRRR